jgi:hypothetical protein
LVSWNHYLWSPIRLMIEKVLKLNAKNSLFKGLNNLFEKPFSSFNAWIMVSQFTWLWHVFYNIDLFYLKKLRVTLCHLLKLPPAGFMRTCRTMSPKLLSVLTCNMMPDTEVHWFSETEDQPPCLQCWFLDTTSQSIEVNLFLFVLLYFNF